MSERTEKAILAGGCFWGMQDLIRKRPGVLSTRVGYTGGDVPNATYRNHGTHAEAIEITFDPDQTSYRDLLEFFFQIHDPSTRNRQGNDVGMSYRSAIFYVDDTQRRVAEDTIADVDASGLWPGPAVTEVGPAGPFWEAEPEHQDYLEHYPNGYTCHFPRADWVLPRTQRRGRVTGMDEVGTDRELVAAFDELIEAIHETRQAAWIAPRGPRRDALDALFAFLRTEAAKLADAEAAMFGRSADMVSPSEQTSRNLIADAHDDPDAVIPLLIARVEAVAGDLRTRAARVDDSSIATTLHEIADGLQTQIEQLAAADAPSE